MSKKKRNILIVIISLAIVLMLAGIGFVGAIIYELRYGYSETTDINAFSGRDGLVNREEYTEYYSHLLGFPSSTEDITVEEFLYRTEHCGLDTTYHIFLRYTMLEDKYNMEKRRLSDISLHYEGKEQKPVYIEDIYEKPVYVMACEQTTIGMQCYEYIILDDEKKEIVCVFLQLADLDETNIPREYLINQLPIVERVSDRYNMYYFEDEKGYSVMPDLEK